MVSQKIIKILFQSAIDSSIDSSTIDNKCIVYVLLICGMQNMINFKGRERGGVDIVFVLTIIKMQVQGFSSYTIQRLLFVVTETNNLFESGQVSKANVMWANKKDQPIVALHKKVKNVQTCTFCLHTQ